MLIGAGVLVLSAFLLAVNDPADATVTCTFDGAGMATVTLDAASDRATISVGSSSSIQVNGEDCEAANTSNTTAVGVTGASGNQVLRISQAGDGGPFPETIAFDVDLGGGTGDELVVIGTDGDDAIALDDGSATIPNAVTVSGVEAIEVHGAGGNDTLDGAGATAALHLLGGPGDDTVVGGNRPDILRGGGGDDALNGRDRNDVLLGGPGADRLSGGPGLDSLKGAGGDDVADGGAGDDDVFGGPGDDELRGGAGRDVLYGGMGHDACFGGPDPDAITGCERGQP